MSMKKSLLALAATALALMGFASSAMAATDGVVRDVTTNAIIPNATELHAVGFAKFRDPATGGTFECHVTSVIKAEGATGTTGKVTSFGIPDTTKCTGGGVLAFCTLTSNTTDNLPYHATVTPPGAGIPAGDFDVTGNIVLTQNFGGFCPIAGANKITFNAITLTPLKTGAEAVTGTSGRLGTTAALNDPIAGIELSGTGTLDKPDGSTAVIEASGKLELSSATQRCTWKIAAS